MFLWRQRRICKLFARGSDWPLALGDSHGLASHTLQDLPFAPPDENAISIMMAVPRSTQGVSMAGPPAMLRPRPKSAQAVVFHVAGSWLISNNSDRLSIASLTSRDSHLHSTLPSIRRRSKKVVRLHCLIQHWMDTYNITTIKLRETQYSTRDICFLRVYPILKFFYCSVAQALNSCIFRFIRAPLLVL
jgi:hypothetical protein